MSLCDICYEQIKDNFWFGLFGDFKLIIDKDTGYFNATKLCDAGGKRFRNWSRLEKSKSMIEYYQKSCRSDLSVGLTYEIKGDNNDELNKQITGTYVPKEFILDIASWISIEFYDRCSNIIIDYYISDFKKYKDDNDQLQTKVQEVEEIMSKLTLENSKLKPTAAPYTDEPTLHNCFVICLKNNSDPLPYHTIRVQKKSLSRALKDVRTKYPDYTIVYQKLKDPNSIKLFNLMREELDIKCFRNDFSTPLTKEELIEKINNLYNERFEEPFLRHSALGTME